MLFVKLFFFCQVVISVSEGADGSEPHFRSSNLLVILLPLLRNGSSGLLECINASLVYWLFQVNRDAIWETGVLVLITDILKDEGI